MDLSQALERAEALISKEIIGYIKISCDDEGHLKIEVVDDVTISAN